MGYYSTLRGEIRFEPELPRYAVKGNEVIYKFIESDYDIALDTEWSTISGPEDQFKAYYTKDNLIQLVNEILKINPHTTFSGFLQIEGEGDGSGEPDLWRLRVKDNKVQEIRPKLVWPED